MRIYMKLSDRLLQVAGMVSECDVVADIGTDHGYVPMYLVEQGRCKRAIAMDINRGPLERAAENIHREQLDEKIETRLSDGLDALNPNEANTIIVAGLGGELMVRILENGKDVLKTVEELILSPHSEWNYVRKHLIQNGYVIREEQMLLDEGKYYVVLKVTHGQEQEVYTEEEFSYGRYLIRGRHPILLEYLKKEHKKYSEILAGMMQHDTLQVKTRMEEIKNELQMIEKVLKKY